MPLMFRSLALFVVLLIGSIVNAAPPNVVIIFADDLGYADLGCFGAKHWKTPHLDRLAAEGVKLTDFHSSQPVCSASRASLMTGCYANRIGIHGALSPQAKNGLSEGETTIAEMLRAKGYATGMTGKWHLGHHDQFLPTNHGFDTYLGLPYSNDMWPFRPNNQVKANYPPLPLIKNLEKLNPNVQPLDQEKLTEQYTRYAEQFIEQHKQQPFFLYFAHTFPHVPLYVGEKWKGSSSSVYGDVIQEIDGSVGRVMAALEKAGVAENTFILFTSDNGPWLNYGNHAGSAGPLREGKGTSYEGGHRVPFVARYPGVIPAGTVQTETAMTIDLLPTIAAWCDAELPKHTIDGKDIRPLLTMQPGAKCPHESFAHYYLTNELQAVRAGKWKLMLPHKSRTMKGQTPGRDGTPGAYGQESVTLALYDLDADVGETTNVAQQFPEVVERMLKYAEAYRAELGDTLTKRTGTGTRPAGQLQP